MQFQKYLIMNTDQHTRQDATISDTLKQKINMTKHLKETIQLTNPTGGEPCQCQ